MTTKAINDLNLAIKLKPDFAQAYFDRGMAYESLSQYPRALSDFAAIALNPRDIESLGTRGKLLDVMGKHKEAIADYLVPSPVILHTTGPTCKERWLIPV